MPQVRPEPLGLQSFLNTSQENNTAPESSNKENDAPAQFGTASQAVEPGSPTAERVPDSQPQTSSQSTDTLPPPLALLLNAIRSSIHSFFTDKPPHTIQRLAELILYPTKHYKTLPAYLRAVDRVTSVTSSADIFPFQTPASENAQTNGIAHPGKSSVYMAPDYLQGLGSDESLGGALLTPIPWLSNASFDGDDEELNGDANVLSESMYTLYLFFCSCFTNFNNQPLKNLCPSSRKNLQIQWLLHYPRLKMELLLLHQSHPMRCLMREAPSSSGSKTWVCKTGRV